MIEIESRGCVALIRDLGAELTSFRVGDDEVIWQSRPEVWKGSAPILFPIIGRLKGGGYTHGGRRYDLAKHGLVRSRRLTVSERGPGTATLTLKADDQTRACYPFDFVFRVTFTLGERRNNRSLRISYQVQNDGDEEMYFSLGSHPAIRLPLDQAPLQDYYLELGVPETLGRHRIVDGLLSAASEPFLDNEREIPLTEHLFDDDALIFKSVESTSVSVKCRRSARAVRIDTGGAPHLGLWAKPGADYVCIEPWWGYDDPADAADGELRHKPGELRHKPGIQPLSPGKTFETAITITLTPLQ